MSTALLLIDHSTVYLVPTGRQRYSGCFVSCMCFSMACNADFHGNQLRLSVVLRLEGKIPSPPKRLQRARPAPLPSLLTPRQQTNATDRSHTGLVVPAKQFHSTVGDMPGGSKPDLNSDLPHQIMERGPSGANPTSSPMKASDIPMHEQINAESAVSYGQMASLPLRRRQARRKQKSSAFNVLMLVRTSTRDALPSPGVRMKL